MYTEWGQINVYGMVTDKNLSKTDPHSFSESGFRKQTLFKRFKVLRPNLSQTTFTCTGIDIRSLNDKRRQHRRSAN